MSKIVLLFVLLSLVCVPAVYGKVLVKDVAPNALRSSPSPCTRLWQLTWPLSGIDSLYTSVLSESTTATVDVDTTNAFMIAGLFAENPKDTVGLFFFRSVADTVIDSLRFAVDYSLDGTTWIAGTYSDYFSAATYNAATGADSVVTQYILGNPSIANGMQILAPFQRVRVSCPIRQRGAGGILQPKKLKELYAYFYRGACS